MNHVFIAQRGLIDMLYPHVGMESYLVVTLSQLGVARMLFGCLQQLGMTSM